MWATAWIEKCGFTPTALGNVDPSQTYRSCTSHVWPLGSHAAVAREPPIRAVPWRWKPSNWIRPASYPQASASAMKPARSPLRPGS